MTCSAFVPVSLTPFSADEPAPRKSYFPQAIAELTAASLATKPAETTTAQCCFSCTAAHGSGGAATCAALPELAKVTTDLQQAIALRQEKQEAFFIALSDK